MSVTPGPSPIYSHHAAAANGTGETVDCTAFTDRSSCEIVITGTATVTLQGSLDYTNSALWVDCAAYTASAWVTIPVNCAYFRTVISGYSSGVVYSAFSRGIADDHKSVLSAQHPSTFTTGAQ